ncbi:glutamine synthetase/guanido kinase [Mollisia scopiformis]|uniref:Glutamine synthetase/guanido kinase n=1 Tax=Mollisia scopiformis TaxID=149040 RepID=A0A194XFA0_MOLSC|nr:glutamine synthetase/guanido kinase [Mollisia scopiformis]KUJ18870.1 glutamine synthetase/guanido kinase [Mollisia scopiformis]
MEDLIKAIYTTPIIDNHAHPLLVPPAVNTYPLLSITTEAHGDAIKATTTSLSHIRAVKQLSDILGCPPTWEDVVNALNVENAKPHHAWAKRCFEGIETVLVDDGLGNKDEIYDYGWHDRLTRSECKKIVRIEKVAEEIIDTLMKNTELSPDDIFSGTREAFEMVIKDAIEDPDVVGFKSVICYRTGLDIPPHLSISEVREAFTDHITSLQEDGVTHFTRVDGQPMNAYLVNKTAHLIANSDGPKKPFQFHTGLGDNDITLTKSSPSHLQQFIRKYPEVPIVLLHASYPWTKEAGYLASVYENVYADIGEVFPFVSKDGQEKVVREILELCPTEKLCWSTDGHWFPETYLLAIIQMREAFQKVFTEYVQDGALTVPQAIRAVEDILFTTSNNLYDLGLEMKPLPITTDLPSRLLEAPKSDAQVLTKFLTDNPTVKFLRIQYLDYTATSRLRVLPVREATAMLKKSPDLQLSATPALLGLLQHDVIIPGVTASGEYILHPVLSSLKPGPYKGYAFAQSEFRNVDGSEVPLCPRTALRRIVTQAASQNLTFLLGFEIEIVFMSRSATDGSLSPLKNSAGHAYGSSRTLHGNEILDLLEDIYDTLEAADIHLQQWHSEAAQGQYEFVLPPSPPLEAVDMLIQAREIITTVAANYSIRATMFPKPFPMMAGTATHAHMSISSPGGDEKQVWEPFWAGVLKHYRAIIAFTYSNPASYDRMVDSCWAGGRWVCWGTQNKEAPLRRVEGSHFEMKTLDGLANPYFAIAAIIAAGLIGVEGKEPLLLGDAEKDPGQLTAEERKELGITEMFPPDLPAALEALVANKEMVNLLGSELVERYVNVKKAEMEMQGKMETDKRRNWLLERY